MESERASGEVDLCVWSEEESANAATVGEASKETSARIAVRGGADVREVVAVEDGAVIVATTGDVQLFDASARLIHDAREKTGSRRVETVSSLPESVGVLVVTADANLKKRKIAAFLVSKAAERRVEVAWELDVNHPTQNEKAKVVSAASDGNTFMILWDDGAWALHDVSDGAIMQQLMLDGLDVQGDEATTGKRRKKSDTMSNLASAASLCLSQDYYAIVANSKEENTVIVAVFDSRYGAVHLAEDVSQGLEHGVGRTSGVSLAATSGSLIVGLSDQVLSVQFDLPELSLASLVGSLSVHSQPSSSAAAVRVLGAGVGSTSNAGQRHATITPKWKLDALKLDTQGVVSLGRDWEEDSTQAMEDKIASTAEALSSGNKKAGASLEALMKNLPVPQILIDSAISGGLTHRAWAPVSMLLAGGHIQGSTSAPRLVAALLQEDMLDEIKDFLVHAKDVSPDDTIAILRASFSRDADDPGVKKRATMKKKEAERVLKEAEGCASNDKLGVEARHDLYARANLLVRAYDEFAPWAQQVHALVARPLDPTVGSRVLRSLSKKETVCLLQYLLAWAQFYASSSGLFARVNTLSEPGVPSARSVVNWTSALLDAQLTTLALSDDVSNVVRSLRDASSEMLDMMTSLASLKGALAHVGENSPLPEQHGVVSTTYTVESVAW